MGAVDSARQVKPLRRPSAGRHIEPDRLSVGEFAISKGDRGDLELALRRPSCQMMMMTNLKPGEARWDEMRRQASHEGST